MKGLYFVLAGLLVLVVALAGCVGKKAEQPPPAEQLPQPASGTPAIEGDITSPEDGGVQIEQPQSGADENVDLGSLI